MKRKTFPTNKDVIIVIISTIVIIVGEVIFAEFFKPPPKLFTFSTAPYLDRNKTSILFKLWRKPDGYVFNFSTPYAYGSYELSAFCISKFCKIPLVIGGNVNFSLRLNDNVKYFQVLNLPNLKMTCNGSLPENTICEFQNMCFSKQEYIVYSPYPLKILHDIVRFGCFIPPFSEDIHKGRFAWQYPREAPNIIIPGLTQVYGLDSYQESDFYFYYNALFPLFHSGFDGKKYNNKINFILSSDRFPLLLQTLTNNDIHTMYMPYCYEKIRFGNKKYVSIQNNNIIYHFPPLSSIPIRKYILEYFGISDSPHKNENVLFVVNSKQLVNSEIVSGVIEEVFSGYNLQILDFSKMSTYEKIQAVSSADILICPHSDALANIMWLKENSTIIEISPFGATCDDKYKEASIAAGTKYFQYTCSEVNEQINFTDQSQQRLLERCWNGDFPCQSHYCFNLLYSQMMIVNISKFKKFISDIKAESSISK